MPFVLDASVALSWHFEDEVSEYAERVLDRLADDTALAPALWALEVVNGLTGAFRRGRIPEARYKRAVQLSSHLRLTLVDVSLDTAFGPVTDLAIQHQLSVYDAAYLHLSIREGLPLATLDDALRVAARRVGLPELT